MKVFISGISGTGMGPLALMAQATGIEVFGTDLHEGAIYPELIEAGIEVKVGPEAQNGEFLREKLGIEAREKLRGTGVEGKDGRKTGVDWFVYTSALPEDHAELKLARETGVKCTKRDDFTAFLIAKLGLKLVAVAGTHGKTTTTAMLIWAATQLGLPVAYLVGSTLSFALSGAYHKGDEFFIYEADEYDRNFLKFHPWLAVLPAVSYDHPDIYATPEEYLAAFRQFCGQSREIIVVEEAREKLDGQGERAQGVVSDEKIKMEGSGSELRKDEMTGGKAIEEASFRPEEFSLAGEARRKDAALAATAVLKMVKELAKQSEARGSEDGDGQQKKSLDDLRGEIVKILDEFPGVGRRFERLEEGIYTDYAHHPEEIAATVEIAREEAEKRGFTGVTVIYEPHQNSRQHEVRKGYKKAFLGADKVVWLPTYLTREDPELAVLTPEELIGGLENKEVAETGEMGEKLFEEILEERKKGRLVILMTAGPADEWLRGKLREKGK